MGESRKQENETSITVGEDGTPYAAATGTSHANLRVENWWEDCKGSSKTQSTLLKKKQKTQDYPSASTFSTIPELQIFF